MKVSNLLESSCKGMLDIQIDVPHFMPIHFTEPSKIPFTSVHKLLLTSCHILYMSYLVTYWYSGMI